MSVTEEQHFRASVTHGGRHYLPPQVPPEVVLHVAALGPGWCELTTAAVPHSIFDTISPRSRHRLILPKALQPWFRGWESKQTLCLVQTRGSSVDILIADVRHARRALATHAADQPQVYRWGSAASPWCSPQRPLVGNTSSSGSRAGLTAVTASGDVPADQPALDPAQAHAQGPSGGYDARV